MEKKDLLKKIEKKKQKLEEQPDELDCMIDALNEQKILP